MQLEGSGNSVRARLGAAVCLLLAAGASSAGAADSEGNPTWRVDASALLYGERMRTTVVEPVARVTRLFANGQTLSAKMGVDAMTGASPTGAMPSGHIQTTTTPSGRVQVQAADEIPTNPYKDLRGLLDVQWEAPIGSHLKVGAGTHGSRERDYRSLGANGTMSLDLWQHTTTLRAGWSTNRDRVFPTSGIPPGLADSTGVPIAGSLAKRSESRLFGISQILSRRLMVALNATRTTESGYLTEPYKVVSLLDADGYTNGDLTEKRPDTRERTDVLASSVYHLSRDVLYLAYRHYWDTWGVRSDTYDVRLRHELEDDRWVQPHLRFYRQSAADFFVYGLRDGEPLPQYATSDNRLGPLKTVTLGLTYGLPVTAYGGEFRIRGELIHQWGDGHPPDAVGVQQRMDLLPPVDIGALTVSYSVDF